METNAKKSNYCERCGDFHEEEREFITYVRVGEAVPDYQFEAYQGGETKTLRFSEFRGKWLVVMFYPADFSAVCPIELQDMQAAYARFKELGAEVVSFSTDTVLAHKAWQELSSQVSGIEFPMGADPSGKIAFAYGVLVDEAEDTSIRKNEGLAMRGTFIIDPKGVLRTMEVHHDTVPRSAEETLRKLQAAQKAG